MKTGIVEGSQPGSCNSSPVSSEADRAQISSSICRSYTNGFHGSE